MKKPVNISMNYNTNGLYRMPWTMSDNSNTWLEITRNCDITCDYCVQDHDRSSHKSIKTIKFEIDELLRLRKTDSMLISGGEPLTHPKLIEVVKMVKSKNVKPFIITNGVSLTPALLKKLKKAGLFGLVFHVDSGQKRPEWINQDEKELNILRQYYADLIYKEKGLVCSFISTIIPSALNQVCDIVSWASQNTHKVMQYILVPVQSFHESDPWDYIVNGEEIELSSITGHCQPNYRNIPATEIYEQLKKALPDYKFNSFLGGTQIADAPKWLFGLYFSSNNKLLGIVGPKGMEMLQKGHHLLKSKYLSFLKPRAYGYGKSLLIFGLFDRGIRQAFSNFIKNLIKDPLLMFKRVHLQSLIIMQPFDVLQNGESDMCDGCPNKTYWNGRLISECRKEEYMQFNSLVQFRYNVMKASPIENINIEELIFKN